MSDHDRIRLNQGRARVRVAEGAEGFRLESPAFDVVDLGTEFAAKVNADGTGTCRVFEGKADVLLSRFHGRVETNPPPERQRIGPDQSIPARICR